MTAILSTHCLSSHKHEAGLAGYFDTSDAKITNNNNHVSVNWHTKQMCEADNPEIAYDIRKFEKNNR